MPLSFSAYLMDNWHHHTQGNKSAKEYVEKFNKFLIRCTTLYKKGEAQILSRLKADHRDDLRTELLVRGVNELEAAYALVQNLDPVRTNYPFNSHDYRASVSRPSPFPNPIGLVPELFHIRMKSRVRVLSRTIKTRALSFSKLVPQPSTTNVKIMNI